MNVSEHIFVSVRVSVWVALDEQEGVGLSECAPLGIYVNALESTRECVCAFALLSVDVVYRIECEYI